MLSDLIRALPGLVPIAAGVALLAFVGRDPAANEHDLADYHEPAPDPAPDRPGLAPSRRNWPLVDVDTAPGGRRRLRPGALLALADPVDSAVTPPTARRLLVDMAVPTRSEAEVGEAAARWLREIAAEQRQMAVAR